MKLVNLLAVLFLVSLATFFMLELVPGDPAVQILGPDATPQQYEQVRDELHLDTPAVERYGDWLGGVVRGDFGKTLLPPIEKVSTLLGSRLPVTLQIAVMSMVMSLSIAIPLGMATAARQGQRADRSANAVLYAALSVPSFLLALLLIYACIFHSWGIRLVVGVGGVAAAAAVIGRRLRIHAADDDPDGRSGLRLVGAVMAGLVIAAVAIVIARNWPQFPRRGFVRLTSDEGVWANVRSALLPAATLAIAEVAVFSRLLRSDMITTLQEDYILAARSRGLPRRRILRVHALRPSTFSLITVAGVSFGRLIGGTVVVEQVFGIPGIGTLMLDAIHDKDYRVVQAAVLLVAAFYVVVNTLVDISYLYLDPRTRRARH